MASLAHGKKKGHSSQGKKRTDKKGQGSRQPLVGPRDTPPCRLECFRLQNGTPIRYNCVGPENVSLARDDQLLRLQLFSPEECRKLLALLSEFNDWDALTDSVDRKSENQHNIFDLAKGTNDGVLYPLCAHLSTAVLDPILRHFYGLTDLKLHWAFIRRYTVDGRVEFPVHRDSSAATVNILLSDPNDFTGAELYLLGNEHKNADSLSDKQFRKLLPEATLRQNYSVPYVQGECCMHLGKRLHGVLPLTSGTRYTLILMYMP